MSYCINPSCPQPENPNHLLYCQACGSELLIQGQYQVSKKISNNNQETTYKVKGNKTTSVLKVLHINEQKNISQFQQQAEVLKQINHPGIPQVKQDGYFTFVPGNSPQPLHCLILEKNPGKNLQQWLEKSDKSLNQELAIAWLNQLLEILDLLHKKQFFAQNIQPNNIILRPNGQLTLINFTLEPQTAQSNFFSLGYTLVYLLTNQPPSIFLNSESLQLNWKNTAPDTSPKLANFIEELISPKQPQTAQTLLHKLAKIEADLYPPVIKNKFNPFKSKLLLGSAVLLLGLGTNQLYSNWQKKLNPQLFATGIQQNQIKKYDVEKIFRQHQKQFILGGIIIILAIAGNHFISYLRIQPKYLMLTLPNGVSLAETLHTESERIYSVVISKDGQILACGNGDGTIKVWQLETREELGIIEGHTNDVVSIALSRNGEILASGSYDGTIKVWELETETELTLQSHFMRVSAIAISPDGEKLVSGSSDDSIKIWHLPTGEMLHTFRGHSDSIYAVSISPDGKTLVTGSQDNIKTWNLETGEEILTLFGHTGRILSVTISPDGNKIATGSSDKTIKIWQLETGKLMRTLRGHSNDINSVVISPDSQTLVSGSNDHTIKIWHLETGKLLRTIKGHSRWVSSVAFSPDGEILATGSFDKTIKLWKLGWE